MTRVHSKMELTSKTARCEGAEGGGMTGADASSQTTTVGDGLPEAGSPEAARIFWRYWGALTTSNLGTAVTGVALQLTAVLVLDATPFEMGLLAAAAYVAWLVIGLPAGALVQRYPLRRVQVAMDLLRAAAVLSLPLAWWSDRLTLVHLLGVALVISFADVVFSVANMTFLPRVVPKDELQSRNSLVSGTYAVTQMGGPSIGGVAVQLLGAVPTFLVDTVSYLVSAVLLGRLPDVHEPSTDTTPIRDRIREGWHFVSRHRVMGPCIDRKSVV